MERRISVGIFWPKYVDHLQRWSRIFQSEKTETNVSIWIPTEISGIFGIMESTHSLPILSREVMNATFCHSGCQRSAMLWWTLLLEQLTPWTRNRVKLLQSPYFFRPSPHAFNPLPKGILYSPSFAHIKRPRWRPVGLNDRHLRSHGKIGDCEQSIDNGDVTTDKKLGIERFQVSVATKQTLPALICQM